MNVMDLTVGVILDPLLVNQLQGWDTDGSLVMCSGTGRACSVDAV